MGGRGGAVEVFVSLRLITSWSFSAGQGPASGGESDPAEGKVRGRLRLPVNPPENRASLFWTSGGRRGRRERGSRLIPSQAVFFSGGLKQER